jgi:hypothetical protein
VLRARGLAEERAPSGYLLAARLEPAVAFSVRSRVRILCHLPIPSVTVDLFRLVESGRFRHQMILAHFDEVMSPCGASCDVCTGVAPDALAAEAMATLGSPRTARPGTVRASAGATALGPEDEALF